MRAPLPSAILSILILAQTLDRPLTVIAQQPAVRESNRPDARPSISGGRPHYVAVAFHDVVDQFPSASNDAITAANLVLFFEWLHANNWTAITLDDIKLAKDGTRPLPDRAVLITFDDGYRSLYTRVYPLLLVYKIPIVAALVGSWMEGPRRETVRKGDDLIPGTESLISWGEAREMAKSSLVEFASHSYDLHQSLPGDPHGTQMPAATTHAFDPARGYETEDAYRKRIRDDLERARALLQKELGRAPRAVAWPFGRYTRAAQEEALAAKFEFLLTMDPEPGFPEDLPKAPRLLPVREPNLPLMVTSIVPDPQTAVRLVRLNPSVLSPESPTEFEKNLGAVIERIRTLGATSVIVDAAIRGPQDRLEAVWFPNRALPVKADVLSRIVWQLRTRAHVNVAVSLPVSATRATLGNDDAVLGLFQNLAYSAPADALVIDRATALAGVRLDRSSSTSRWEVRRRRNSLDLSHVPAADALALRAFFTFENVRPECRLFLLVPAVGEAPSAIADLTLVETPLDEKRFRQLVDGLAASGWLDPDRRYSCGVWIRSEKTPSPAALSANVRLFQRRGGVAFGWEQDDPIRDEPKAALVGPSVSAARFPVRF